MPSSASNSRPADTSPAWRWTLDTRRSRTRFLALGSAAVLLYLAAVCADYAAKVMAGSLQADRVTLAARLDPFNAAYPHILGRIAFYERQDVAAAIDEYRIATHLNRFSARYWLDLANAQQIAARADDSRRSLEQALAADPTNPQVANEAANYYLVLGDLPAALRLLHTVVQYSPEDARAAVELSWRATQDPDAVMDQVLPQTTDAYLMLLHLLMSRRQNDAADRVWGRMFDLKQNLPADSAFPYIEYLLGERQVARAKAAWDQLLQRNDSLRGYLAPGNLVSNPGFEEDILNGGFSWRYEASPHVALAVDQRDAYRGRRSLSVRFDGEPVSDAGIGQFIVVDPDTTYLFSAWVKTSDLEGAGGPQLAVLERYSGKRLYLSGEFAGSMVWRRVEGEFHTDADTLLVMVRIVRVPGTTRMRGNMWLDEVSVVRK